MPYFCPINFVFFKKYLKSGKKIFNITPKVVLFCKKICYIFASCSRLNITLF